MNKYIIFGDGLVKINTIVSSETFVKDYCERNGYTYSIVEEPEPEPQPEPMTQTEMEEMLLDQEYRILLLEYGLEDIE